MAVTVFDISVTRAQAIRLLRHALPRWNVYRSKLNYWHKTGLIQAERPGTGGIVYYSMQEVILLATIGQLLEGGLSLQSVRKVIDWFQHHAPDLIHDQIGELCLAVTDDGDAAWYDPHDPNGAHGLSVLKRPGQRYLLPTNEITRQLLNAAKEEGLLQAA